MIKTIIFDFGGVIHSLGATTDGGDVLNGTSYALMLSFVEELKGKGYNVYLLSNTIQPHVDFFRSKGLYDYFDKVFLSNEIGLRKPDVKIYEHVIKDLGIKAEETLYVDDLEDNLTPAQKLGMGVILAQSPEQIISDVRKMLI